MSTIENKEWRSTYQKMRTARQRLSLVRSRIELGRDIETGLRYAEVEKLALMRLKLSEAEFEAVARPDDHEMIQDAYESAISLICGSIGVNPTPEMSGAVADLLREAHFSRSEWQQTAN